MDEKLPSASSVPLLANVRTHCSSQSYQPIISGISALKSFKRFFHKIMLDRGDYENLLSITIGIKTNKF